MGRSQAQALASCLDTQVGADGATWIWNLVADYPYEVFLIVDWYHASEHLGATANLAFGDESSLFVMPAALFLNSALSFLVAYLFVPDSPIDSEYFLGQEIMASANSFIAQTVIGLILAVVYLILYRKIAHRLPGWLRSETVALTWKDLRLPALLAGVSVVIGLIIIT